MNLFVSKLVCRILFCNAGVSPSLDLQKEVSKQSFICPLPIALITA